MAAECDKVRHKNAHFRISVDHHFTPILKNNPASKMICVLTLYYTWYGCHYVARLRTQLSALADTFINPNNCGAVNLRTASINHKQAKSVCTQSTTVLLREVAENTPS